jgi:hypothetical protein
MTTTDPTTRLRAVMDVCDEIERGNPDALVAAAVLRIHRAALGDAPAHRGPGRPPSELPDWAIVQLSDQGMDAGDVTHFFEASGGRKIAAAVNGKPVHLTRP